MAAGKWVGIIQSPTIQFRFVFFSFKSLLSCLLTDFAEIWYTFDQTLDQNSTKIFAKSVDRRPRKEVSDATFKGKKHQPKFEGRTLVLYV